MSERHWALHNKMQADCDGSLFGTHAYTGCAADRDKLLMGDLLWEQLNQIQLL